MQTLSYFPGQEVTIFLEITDGYHTRLDVSSTPMVTRVIFPSLTLAASYPQLMTQLDVGLFYYKFILPSGSSSLGSYLVDVSYLNPITNMTSNVAYQVIVNAPYGNFSATVSV